MRTWHSFEKLGAQHVTQPHTYPAAGTYRITLQSNEHDFGKKLADIVPYWVVFAVAP